MRVSGRTHALTFVKAANSVSADITISKGGADPVSARSILAVLSLDVRNGDQVTLAASGAAAAALDSLAALLTTGLEA
jgi:phosphocarrier protein HPr